MYSYRRSPGRTVGFLAAVAALVGFSDAAHTQLTRQEAIDLVTAQVISSSPYITTLAAYSYTHPGRSRPVPTSWSSTDRPAPP